MLKIGRFRFTDRGSTSGTILCADARGRSKDAETPMQRFQAASRARHSRDDEAKFLAELHGNGEGEDGEQPESDDPMARQHSGQLSLAAKMQRFKSTSDARHGLNKSPKGRGGRR